MTTGQIWKSYYFAGSQRVAMRETTSSSDTVYYFVADHLGSTSVTLDVSGNKIGEMKYYAVPRSAAEWVSLRRDTQWIVTHGPPLYRPTRLLPGQATLPSHQVNLINWVDKIFAEHGKPYARFTASAQKGTRQDLIDALGNSNQNVVVTMNWDGGKKSGHAVVLAAYDETHFDRNGIPKPWGFINSHGTGPGGSPELLWLGNADFSHRWTTDILLIGNSNMVTIKKQ